MEHTQEQVNAALNVADEFRRTHASGQYPHNVTVLAAEVRRLREEINQARKAWLGDDYAHMSLLEAMQKFRRDAETDRAEKDDEIRRLREENAHLCKELSACEESREEARAQIAKQDQSILLLRETVDTGKESRRVLDDAVQRMEVKVAALVAAGDGLYGISPVTFGNTHRAAWDAAKNLK